MNGVRECRSLSRDDLKQILFEWLKERGIIGELQAFLRLKMVESLDGTDLMPRNKCTSFTARDRAISMVVWNYLKHHKMHYTLSVFASECVTTNKMSLTELDDSEKNRAILSSLNISGHLIRESLRSATDDGGGKPKCVLEILVDVCRGLGVVAKHFKGNEGSKKLLINAQSQTDTVNIQATQGSQTAPIECVQTQTEPHLNTLPTIGSLQEEVNYLRKKLQESESALRACQQSQCQTSPRKHVPSPVEPPSKSGYHRKEGETRFSSDASFPRNSTNPSVQSGPKIQEALHFLNNVDNRLRYLDRKYQSLIKKQPPDSLLHCSEEETVRRSSEVRSFKLVDD